ncbi:hypothetical protein [Streptomyces sp. BF23-19]|uniref:hypothetical protein n=1 Tax=Streptomyces TaxID=1883 RepID=UPI0034E58402|nr:hypothetical protein OG253_07665 [Streptomyces virginiae]
MAAPLRLAVVPMLAPTAPRLTHLTKSFVETVMISVRDYYQRQSSGRANWSYEVFDWYRMPIPQVEFEKLGPGLGDRALPLLARDISLNASQFTHFAFILDHEGVGQGGAWFPQLDQIKYLHIGAPDLSPSLLEHELGHMFGLGHANLDLFPSAPAEYEDYFCVMGSTGVYGFADKAISFKSDFGDPDWFLCTQCGTAFRERAGDVSLCPGAPPGTAGHRADPELNYNPRHEPPTSSSDEESSWRLCGNCGAIFYHGAADHGHCPVGGGHKPSTDGTPSLILRYGSPPIKAERGNWQQCVKCRVLYKTDAAGRRCTVTVPTAEHEPVPAGHVYVLPIDGDNNLSGPGFCAPMLEAAGWLDPAVHGADIGAQLVNRPGSTEVELMWLRGVPAAGPVQALVYAYAEGLAAGRIYVEFRGAGGDDDVKLPQSSPGTSGWVLVHVQQPGNQAHLLARLSSVTGASAYVQYADLHVRVIAEPSFNRVRLGITSGARAGWPAQHLTSKTVLQELSEVRPAIASGTAYVALAWTGTDDHLNSAISADGGRTFAPKMHPVEKSGNPPSLAGGDLYIAWTGIDKRLNVGELFGVFAMGGPVTLPETSDFGPALARDRDGKLFLAWTGEDNSLNMILSTDDGWTWIGKETFGLKSNGRPALASDPTQDRMFLAWRTEEDLQAAEVKLRIDEDMPEGSPGRYAIALGEILTPNEISEDAPSLAVHDHRFYLGWTGTDETLNLSGPMFTPALPAKRVLAPERSENDIDLTAHEDTVVVGWTGTDETLNVGIMDMGSRGRRLDDLQTGATHMVALPTTTGVSFQTGSMIGGSRRVRILNRHRTARAEVDLWAMFDRGLELQLEKNHGGATLELTYGPTDDAAVPALGLDLTQGGADRLRVNISQLGGAGLNIDAWLVTQSRISIATSYVSVRGPVDFLFVDFDQDLLSNVDRLILKFEVFRSTAEKPTLVIDSIEARGPADG